jgi:hypothetical protein
VGRVNQRDALVQVIEALHDEIGALKANDTAALERATEAKLAAIDALAGHGAALSTPELRMLAEEAHRLNETCRIYVNLMAANVRRRLQMLTGSSAPAYGPAGAFA